ncbi:MAG: hypothetical protein V1664_00370 [Candidatus Uhrbacteria bacterium]
MKSYQLLDKEQVASIRDIQKNPSQALRGITRVMRGGKTFGFFFSNEEFDEILEDLEAGACLELRRRVKAARQGLKKSQVFTVEQLAAKYGL